MTKPTHRFGTGPGTTDTSEMVTALVRLREGLASAVLPLDLPGVEAQRRTRAQLLEQLEDYVLPRLIQTEAPVLAVVGGSTGAGKSTLVNSLVGRSVTESGVLRPTTRSPVLVHHPADTDWFAKDRILPDLARTTEPSAGPGALQLVADEAVPQGLAILDAPDVDSVSEQDRTLATQLLRAADLWLFVTSAARYADQVPWELLRAAAERSTAVAVVLDRTPPAALAEVSSHLARMLTSRGLRDSPLFTVPETPLDGAALLQEEAVAEIRSWLRLLASEPGTRAAVVSKTLDGAVRGLARRAHTVADAEAEQVTVLARLREQTGEVFRDATEKARAVSADGSLLRGEVLLRWQELVGTGPLFGSVESHLGRVRDRVVAAVRGRRQPAEQASQTMQAALRTVLVERAEIAAQRASGSWRSAAPVQHLLEKPGGPRGRASRELRAEADRLVREWQQTVLELVRAQESPQRSTPRFLTYGAATLAVALMSVVLAGSAETEGGSTSAARKLLHGVYGDEAAGRIASRAREDLDRRIRELFAAEQGRWEGVLDEVGVRAETADRLRDAARRIDDLRFAAETGPAPAGTAVLQELASDNDLGAGR